MSTSAAERRQPQAPGWLIEVARMARGPVPWAGMALAPLAIVVPLAVGLAAGRTVTGVLVAVGGVVAVMADRMGPYSTRVRRIATAGIFGGAAGLLVGTVVNGRGWLAVAVMVAVAGVSALLSSISAIWSTTGLYLLVYAALATGPLGAIRPWWQPPLWLLAGVGWTLLLLVPGWLLHPRKVEEHRVAAVYQALAVSLRALGTERFTETRRGVTAALNVAYEELLGQRAAASGRDRRLSQLVTLLNQARLIAETSAALSDASEQPPPQVAAQADALADAVLNGNAVPAIGRPSTATPGLLALYGALDGAAGVVSGARAAVPDATGDGSVPWERRRPLAALAEEVREGFAPASTFAVRLMICIGVAGVFSEVLPLQRSYWVLVAVAVVMKPDFGSVFARALQYGAGTVIGAIVAVLILAAGPPDAVLLAPMVVLAALLPYGMSRNYGLFGVFFTTLMVLLIDLLAHGGWRLANARLVDILLGCGVVLVAGYAPWPTSWHANLPRDFAAAVEAAARYLEALGQAGTGTAASAHADARRRLATLGIELQCVLAEPERVQRRVVAWWPSVVALERLLDAITATAVTAAGEPLPAAAVSEISTALRRVAAAARTGAPLQREAPSPAPQALELVSDAVRSLQDVYAETPATGVMAR